MQKKIIESMSNYNSDSLFLSAQQDASIEQLVVLPLPSEAKTPGIVHVGGDYAPLGGGPDPSDTPGC
jgi:hypothetical protein